MGERVTTERVRDIATDEVSAATAPWITVQNMARDLLDARRERDEFRAKAERLERERDERTKALTALRTYLTRSIREDAMGMDEAIEMLNDLDPADLDAVDAWTKEMADPSYWNKDVARLEREVAELRAQLPVAVANARGAGYRDGVHKERERVVSCVEEAIGRPISDGGQYRADIESAIRTALRKEAQ